MFRKCSTFIIMILISSIVITSTISSQQIFSEKSVKSYNIDLIFNEMHEKIENADTKEKFNIIFKETLIELDKHNLLDNIELVDALKFICTDTNNYLIYGESTQTNFLGIVGIKFYEMEGFNTLWKLLYRFKNTKQINFHINSWVTFGSLQISRSWRIYNQWPAKGCIKILDSGWEREYDSGYGHIDIIGGFPAVYYLDSIYHCLGVTGFTGISIGKYYFGQADQVDIRENRPGI